MATGTSTYKGLAVPLHGEVELKQDTLATDFVTLTGDSSISGDFLVCKAGSTERFVIEDGGRTVAAGGADLGDMLVLATGKTLKFSTPLTTAPTTGLVAGEMFLCLASGTPQLGVAVNPSGSATDIWYFTANTTAFT